MKTVSAGLGTHLATANPTTLAYLWKVKRVDGTVLGFTTHDQDIVYDDGSGDGDGSPPSVTYLAATGLKNTAVEGKSDLSVDNLEVDTFIESDAVVENSVRSGIYDFAEWSEYLVNWADLSQGHMIMRTGSWGKVSMGNGLFTVDLRGLTNKLGTKIVDTYGPLCRAEFGSGTNGIDMDSQWLCMKDVSLLRETGTVDAVTDNKVIVPVAGLSGAVFDNGVLTFTSGNLSGLSYDVKFWDGTSIEFFLPMFVLPVPGDTFTIEPGCDKTLDDCIRYDNVINRHAEDFIPGNDAMLDTPNL